MLLYKYLDSIHLPDERLRNSSIQFMIGQGMLYVPAAWIIGDICDLGRTSRLFKRRGRISIVCYIPVICMLRGRQT